MTAYFAADDLVKGDVVCLTGGSTGIGIVSKADPTTAAAFGVAFAIVTSTSAAEGSPVNIQSSGFVPISVSSLAATAGLIRLSSAGRCELVTSYSVGDYPLGATDNFGTLTWIPRGPIPAPYGANSSTRALVQAIVAPANNLTVYSAEVGAAYKFDTSSSATADGWTILAANDATPGRWLLQGDTISLAPLGGTSDDWPRLIDSLRACAPKGIAAHLRGGTWLAKSSPLATGLYIPNNSVIVGSPGVSIVQTITTTGSALETAFAATFTVSGAISTLSANAVKGSRTLVVNGAPGFIVGDYILVSELLVTGIRAAIYKVRNLTGSGPYTVTVDRPILFNFVTNDTVQKTTPAQGIKIYGNGMRISGAGARLIELYGAVDCEVHDVLGNASQCVERAMSIDVGSYNCHVSRCYFDNGAGSCPIGLSFESTEACSAADCIALAFTQNGHYMQDSQVSCFNRCWSYSCSSGFSISTGAGGVLGANDNTITDCFAGGCTSTGFVLSAGSSRNSFKGCVASDCPQGFSLQAGTTLSGNSFASCKAVRCSTAGILVGANSVGTLMDCFTAEDNSVGVRVDVGAKGTRFINLAVYRSTSTGCTLSDEATFSSGSVVDCPIGVAVTSLPAASVVRFRDLDISTTINASSGVQITNASAGRVLFDGCRVTMSGTGSIGVQHLVASVVVLSNVEGSGGAGSYGYAGVAGATVRSLGRVDFTGYPTEYLIDAAGFARLEQLGPVSKAVTTADVTLTFSEAQSSTVTTTGVLTGNRNLILPTVNGMEWSVFCNNTGAFTTTFKTAAGTGIVVAQGKRAVLQCDGTNIVRVTADT